MKPEKHEKSNFCEKLVCCNISQTKMSFFIPRQAHFTGLFKPVMQRRSTGLLSANNKKTRDGLSIPHMMFSVTESCCGYVQLLTHFLEENLKGSIEPGKLADLAVISEDFLTCPEVNIKNIKVDITMVGGKIVYKR